MRRTLTGLILALCVLIATSSVMGCSKSQTQSSPTSVAQPAVGFPAGTYEVWQRADNSSPYPGGTTFYKDGTIKTSGGIAPDAHLERWSESSAHDKPVIVLSGTNSDGSGAFQEELFYLKKGSQVNLDLSEDRVASDPMIVLKPKSGN